MDVAADGFRGGQSLVGGILERLVVVFGEQQRCHQIAPASLSLPTSSATDPTFTPAWRPPGSLVFTIWSRGLMSTPNASGDFSSIGFFFAFMMFGSDA